MESKLELKSIWEDTDLFEVNIYASNGTFAGNANCYSTRKEIAELSNLLKDYPSPTKETIHFTTGENDQDSYFSISLRKKDSLGHIILRVKIAHIETYSNAPTENYLSEFDILVEPAAIDDFSKSLKILSGGNIGGKTAKLNGQT